MRVVRWTRYGHDRLYVSADDGSRVGWFDLKTGRTHLEQSACAAEFRAALEGQPLYRDHPQIRLRADRDTAAASPLKSAAGAPEAAPLERTEPQPSEQPWQDLAANRPGLQARDEAQRQLAAAREQSRVLTGLRRLVDAHTDERAWRKGAEGEETVGSRLDRLSSRGWRVLHSIPVGSNGADIDHLLIGPGGVYTVNTKNHPGKKVWVAGDQIRIDGHPVPYVRNARHEAQRAGELLSRAVGWPVSVRPVLVLLTGSLIPDVTIKARPDDVLVLDRMNIPGAFRRAPRRISDEQIQAVYEQARRSTTWQR